jgi:uncharacterized protein YsxB (DUF464 family)
VRADASAHDRACKVRMSLVCAGASCLSRLTVVVVSLVLARQATVYLKDSGLAVAQIANKCETFYPKLALMTLIQSLH